MLGNAFEALVGAIYLDSGYGRCMRFIERQILKHLINIDKVAYKEVNFKSKLLEWSQKNKLHLDFTLIAENMEAGATPTFQSQVVVEGIVCGQGKGYSKKESQQLAAKEALLRLKKKDGLERQVFDAKGKRTAMEEEPLALLPNISEEENATHTLESLTMEEIGKDKEEGAENKINIDFSDVGSKPKSRDEIIAEAEEKAFAEE